MIMDGIVSDGEVVIEAIASVGEAHTPRGGDGEGGTDLRDEGADGVVAMDIAELDGVTEGSDYKKIHQALKCGRVLRGMCSGGRGQRGRERGDKKSRERTPFHPVGAWSPPGL